MNQNNQKQPIDDRVRPMALTVKTVIFNQQNNQVLLLKRAKDDKLNQSKWDLPGGHIDAGETIEEAIQREPSDQPEGTVLRVIRKGYTLKDRLLRPANVVVAHAPEPEPEV